MAARKPPTKGQIRRRNLEIAVEYPLDWLEERSGLVGGVKYFLFRNVPRDTNWMQTLGSATLTAFLVQAVTGVILAMYYQPTPTGAYPSIVDITDHLTMGWLVRGMHKWGASVFIILMFLHMGRVFLFGAYKYPRELNWIVGVLLLASALAEGFTGYLLPWDQTAYWASVVGINLNGTAPFLGPWLAQFLRSGQEISASHAHTLLLAAHARAARRDRRADRAAPVPRDPARRHLAAVVEGRRGPGAPRGAVRAAQGPDRRARRVRVVAAEKPSNRTISSAPTSRATSPTSRSAGSRSSRTRWSRTRS